MCDHMWVWISIWHQLDTTVMRSRKLVSLLGKCSHRKYNLLKYSYIIFPTPNIILSYYILEFLFFSTFQRKNYMHTFWLIDGDTNKYVWHHRVAVTVDDGCRTWRVESWRLRSSWRISPTMSSSWPRSLTQWRAMRNNSSSWRTLPVRPR